MLARRTSVSRDPLRSKSAVRAVRSGWGHLLIALCLPLVPAALGAQIPSTLDVHFQSQLPCAPQQAFETELGRMMQGWNGATRSSFAVTISSSGDTWAVKLAVEQGGRTFVRAARVGDCTLAVKLAALLVVISIDPGLAGSAESLELLGSLQTAEIEEPQPDEETVREPAPTTVPTANISEEAGPDEPADPAQPGGADKVRILTSLHLAAGLGSFTPVGLGPGGELVVLLERLRLSFATAGLFSPREPIPGGDGGTFRSHGWITTLGVGFEQPLRRVILHLAVGAATHTLFATSNGIPASRTRVQTVGAAWLGGSLLLPFTREFGAQITAELHTRFSSAQFRVEGAGAIRETGYLVGFGRLGLFLTF